MNTQTQNVIIITENILCRLLPLTPFPVAQLVRMVLPPSHVPFIPVMAISASLRVVVPCVDNMLVNVSDVKKI